MTTTPVAAAQTMTVTAGSLTYTGPPNIIDKIDPRVIATREQVISLAGTDFPGTLGRLEPTGVPPIFLTFGLRHDR